MYFEMQVSARIPHNTSSSFLIQLVAKASVDIINRFTVTACEKEALSLSDPVNFRFCGKNPLYDIATRKKKRPEMNDKHSTYPKGFLASIPDRV